MKNRLLSMLTVFVLLFVFAFGAMVPVQAASKEATISADALYSLGLFSGTGTDADGKPIYELDRAPTRNEAVAMLVRLLGKETEAKAGEWEIPFTDVAAWAKPYVGYAYAKGLTAGTSATTYSGDAKITASQYLTFVLRSLGYDSSKDFKWDRAWELSDKIGLTDGRYDVTTKTFLRGDVTIISNNSLQVKQKDSDKTLADKLIAEGVFTKDAYENKPEQPEVIKETAFYIPPVTFSIEGKELYLGGGISYKAEAGTYVVTPYWNNERFTDFTVEVASGSGSVKKNSDGTFTVKFNAKDRLDISLWYDFKMVEMPDDKGNMVMVPSQTKRSLTFSPPVPKKGFAVDRNGLVMLPGEGFGDNFSPYFVMDVYYDGVRLTDYEVTADKNAPFEATVQADGSLLMMVKGKGGANFTVKYNGKTATFNLNCG